MEEQIKNIALKTKEVIHAEGFNIEGVKTLENFIEVNRDLFSKMAEIEKNSLISALGSFLLISIIETYGGRIHEDKEFGWGVKFDDNEDQKNMVFPYSKVRKQFENGSEDSVKSLFEVIPTIFKDIKK